MRPACKAVCIPSLLFCHIPLAKGWAWASAIQRDSISSNWSMNVHPQGSTTCLHSGAHFSDSFVFFFLRLERKVRVTSRFASDNSFRKQVNWLILHSTICIHCVWTRFIWLEEKHLRQGGADAQSDNNLFYHLAFSPSACFQTISHLHLPLWAPINYNK